MVLSFRRHVYIMKRIVHHVLNIIRILFVSKKILMVMLMFLTPRIYNETDCSLVLNLIRMFFVSRKILR